MTTKPPVKALLRGTIEVIEMVDGVEATLDRVVVETGVKAFSWRGHTSVFLRDLTAETRAMWLRLGGRTP